MKSWLLVVLVLGCSAKKEAPKERPSVADPMGFCDRERAVMMHRRPCFPEDVSIKMGLAEITERERTAPAEPAARRRVAAECAVMLDSMMRAEQPAACPLDVTPGERAELAAFLSDWYGERSAAPAGNAELTKLAAQRDAACACKDLKCLHAAADDMEKSADPIAVKIFDETARCKQRLTYGAPSKGV